MRTIVRKDCSYDEYALMMDYIDTNCPFGIYQARYNARLKLAVIGFWDSDYIPDDWNHWVVRPVSIKLSHPYKAEVFIKGTRTTVE